MELSIFFAKVLGLYLVIVCTAVFLSRGGLEAAFQEFEESRIFAFFSGAMVLLLGLSIVISHPIWEANWRGVITALGWLTVVKGITRLFFFNRAITIAKKLIHSGWYWCIIGLSFGIGLWLTYVGFTY